MVIYAGGHSYCSALLAGQTQRLQVNLLLPRTWMGGLSHDSTWRMRAAECRGIAAVSSHNPPPPPDWREGVVRRALESSKNFASWGKGRVNCPDLSKPSEVLKVAFKSAMCQALFGRTAQLYPASSKVRKKVENWPKLALHEIWASTLSHPWPEEGWGHLHPLH